GWSTVAPVTELNHPSPSGDYTNPYEFFVKLRSVRLLEFLDHPHIPEPPQVVIEAARIPNSVSKLECKRLWRIFAEDVGHTHGHSSVVEDSLPARHGVRNRWRFLLLAHHSLPTLRIPRHRRRFYRRREDQGVGKLRVVEPGGMHPVTLILSIPKLEGLDLLPVSIQEMHSPVQVPVVPCPVEGRVPSPFQPRLGIGYVPEKVAYIPLRTRATGCLPRP